MQFFGYLREVFEACQAQCRFDFRQRFSFKFIQ